MSSAGGEIATVAESINKLLAEICDADYQWECPRRFSAFAERLDLLLNQFFKSTAAAAGELPTSAQTALRGIAADISKANLTLNSYRTRSKIYVLINCQTLCDALLDCSTSIARWLALLQSSLAESDSESADLRRKTADLSSEMQLAQFKVTENEERVYSTLQKEVLGRQSTKAVQSAIIMDLARALGIESDNHGELARQIELLKKDMTGTVSPSDRRISVCLGRIFDNWSVEPRTVSKSSDPDFEEDAHIQPFKSFICPLTKQVMKDPVVLESSQSYERAAIQYWFDRCADDGREPTCPVTGRVLKSLKINPNLGLAGAIDEWISRNIDIQIISAVQHLSEEPASAELISNEIKNMHRISDEHPSKLYKVRNAGLVPLIVRLLRDSSSEIVGPGTRSRVLMTLLNMAKDEESKNIMIEEGVMRLAIHSLIGNLKEEGEFALKLLLEFSSDEHYCTKLAIEKGALLLLTSIAGDTDNPSLANLAEEILKNIEKVETNIQHLAAAGRFQPLLNRLCEGSLDVKIEMASMVGKMALANNGKEQIARHGARVLVKMLSSDFARLASLQALHNLSSLDDNTVILVDSGVLSALTTIIFSDDLEVKNPLSDIKELAASTLGNLVSKPGHWESPVPGKEGNSLLSEHTVHKLLQLLAHSGPKNQLAFLCILSGIASSPRAEVVAFHIKSGNGVPIVVSFLGHSEAEHRLHAFRLASVLSENVEQALAHELRSANKLTFLKEKVLDEDASNDEKALAASILANIKLSHDEVKRMFDASLIRWIVGALKEQKTSSSRGSFRRSSSLVEGLLGLLVHVSRSSDPDILNGVKENNLMAIFRDVLCISSRSRSKQLAAQGLRYLSETVPSFVAAQPTKPQPSKGFFFPLNFVCCREPPLPAVCPVHNAGCDEDNTFCLLKGHVVKPLVELLRDDSSRVQKAAVEALSTLVSSPHNLKQTVQELDQLGVVQELMSLFGTLRPGVLQEKVIWMVEKILRVESEAQAYSTDQGFVKCLVDAFKYGNANTKRLAQDSLTNLKQLSGVAGKNSCQHRGRFS
ncbi:unnamed protein product [Victoria cruziana]